MITGWYDHETDLFCGDYLAISEYFINGVPVYLGKPYYKHGTVLATARGASKDEAESARDKAKVEAERKMRNSPIWAEYDPA